MKSEWFEHDLDGKQHVLEAPEYLRNKGLKVVDHEYKIDHVKNRVKFRIIYEVPE